MINKKIKLTAISIFLTIFLPVIGVQVYSQSDSLGCCSNPNAGTFSCAASRLVFRNKECCPQPEASFPDYYKSAQNPNGPENYAECASNFFYENKACSAVDSCAIGCCCTDLSSSLVPQSQCQGTASKFYKGQTNCNEVCKVPQCSDGIDNDNNGCADYGKDTECTSPSDAEESGGTCLQEPLGCNDPSYTPKLSDFQINVVKGQKKLLLQWQDECKSSSLFYEVSRCEGVGCTNFDLVATINTNKFEDSSDALSFGKTFTYEVKSFYNLQSATPTIFKTATLGDEECIGRTDESFFCRNNSGFYCNSANKLIQEGTKCTDAQICVINNNRPLCFAKSECDYKDFGLYPTKDGCEKGKDKPADAERYKYCFYDRSSSTVDYCFNCDPSMSCYDYKTEQACASDNCKIKNCQWQPTLNGLELGACISTGSYNCQWCDRKGTAGIGNLKSYNEIFDICTQQKSDALSQGQFKCYFKEGKSTSCSNVVCMDYSTEQCSNARITHDQYNNIANPSQDQCGIQVCQNINNACAKNADGDDKADCSGKECEQDYFPPRTVLLPIIKKGILDGIGIQIYDKTSFDSSEILSSTLDYTTFFCLEPCSPQGHPYKNSTQSRRLIVSNLNAFDGNNGSLVMPLNEGANSILYYSQDPARNIGAAKRITIEAHASITGPKVLSVNVTNGNLLYDKLYTNSTQPTIYVKFLEPAVVTSSRLVAKGTGTIIPLTTTTNLGNLPNLTVSRALTEGEYKLEINAKNQNNIVMDPVFAAYIVVDSTKPDVNITPSKGDVLNSSIATIILAYNEEVTLDSLKLNSEDFKNQSATVNNRIFILRKNLSDGNKVLEVTASDFAKNQITNSTSFIVNTHARDISLVNPKFGVAPSFTFNLNVGTDNNAECRYDLDDLLEFEFMDNFDSTGGLFHIKSNFNEIREGDNTTHKLYVKCKDTKFGISGKTFDLSVDTSKPNIKNAFAYPNPIIESPITTTFTAESDELAICKASRTFSDFDSMDKKFDGFDDNNFRTINKLLVTLDNEGSYLFNVACKNKAGLVSDAKQISFLAKLSDSIKVISHTPEYFNTTAAVLAIETNKKSQCKHSESDQTAQSGIVFGSSSYSHTAQLTLPTGTHTFYIICKDQYLQQWSGVSKITFLIDTTPPTMLYVNDTSTDTLPKDITCNTDRLRLKSLAEDMESGIREYWYTILQNNKPIIDWTRTFSGGQWLWAQNLALQDNSQYFFKVKANNYAGLESDAKLSDGITVDTSVCKPIGECSDGLINQPGEECDTGTFGVISSCLNYTNFVGGVLGCTNNCKLDTSQCTRIPDCGNGRLDPGESCDRNIFGGIDACTKYSNSFSGGTLKCTSTCQLDTSSCTEKPKCGNSAIDQGESCDSTNLGPLSGTCADYNPSTFTEGSISCNSCGLDTSKCQGIQGSCNDGVINIGESCDGKNFGKISSCTDFNSFIGGTLTCNSNCQLNTSACVEKPKCGNSAIDQGESCDSTNLGPLSGRCSDYSSDFSAGSLKCTSCKLDTNDCTKSQLCGNSRLDTGEICDNTLFSTITNLSCIAYSSTFTNGTISCSSCKINTNDCGSNATNNPQPTCKDRGDCKINELCSDNSECESKYCAGNRCKQASCSDGVKNQDEANIDCGGVCSSCQNSKSCRLNSDCQSNSCILGICKGQESCSDGKLSPGEANIDCGGACPDKCSEGNNCDVPDDCADSLECISNKCRAVSTGTGTEKCNVDNKLDSDCDGMPDDWEIQNGLNPHDPNDAAQDPDNDGLANKDEYGMVHVYSSSTDPNKTDTDGDGFSDKTEMDSNTNPLDSSSFPKSSFTKVVLFIIGIVVLLSGFGYLGFIAVKKRNEQQYRIPEREVQRTTLPSQQPQRQAAPVQRPLRVVRPFKKTEDQKDFERKKLFESFGEEKTGVQLPTAQKEKPKAEPQRKQVQRKAIPKKPKEDVFSKLKSIASESKKKTGKTKNAAK